ncbi:phosphoadenosine phosphosulfate reductase domain-containing protein [Nocardia sp. IFM 10818]
MTAALRGKAAPDNPYRSLLVQPAADQLLADVRDLLETTRRAIGPAPVDLHHHDLVLINSSAGKDSQAMLAYLVALADTQGYPRSRLVVVHADLGRVEWPGTCELAAAHARSYGLRFETVSRAEDLLDQVLARRRTLDAQADTLEADARALHAAGWHRLAEIAADDAHRKRRTRAWMSSTARFCTSDQKTSQVAKLMTRLVGEWRGAGHHGRMRILNCLGIRAAESAARAKKTSLHRDSASNGKREVTRWLPLFEWTEEQVWDTIRASGLPWHPAYDLGSRRLSCAFCMLAGRQDLVRAAQFNPELALQYLDIETRVGHPFRTDLSMQQIVASATPIDCEPGAVVARPQSITGIRRPGVSGPASTVAAFPRQPTQGVLP